MEIVVEANGAVTRSTVLEDAATPLQQACVDAVFARHRAPGNADAARTLHVELPALGGATPVAPSQVHEDGAAESMMRARVDEHRDAILACVERGTVAVVANWDAEGGVTFALRGDLAGTPEEGCVRAVGRGLRISPVSTPGAILHAVTR